MPSSLLGLQISSLCNFLGLLQMAGRPLGDDCFSCPCWIWKTERRFERIRMLVLQFKLSIVMSFNSTIQKQISKSPNDTFVIVSFCGWYFSKIMQAFLSGSMENSKLESENRRILLKYEKGVQPKIVYRPSKYPTSKKYLWPQSYITKCPLGVLPIHCIVYMMVQTMHI